jgi:hypothetical protein
VIINMGEDHLTWSARIIESASKRDSPPGLEEAEVARLPHARAKYPRRDYSAWQASKCAELILPGATVPG